MRFFDSKGREANIRLEDNGYGHPVFCDSGKYLNDLSEVSEAELLWIDSEYIDELWDITREMQRDGLL